VRGGGQAETLADRLVKIKSMVTANTSPIAQAVIAGKLLEHSGSLVAANSREIALYQDKRRRVLGGVRWRFAGARSGGTSLMVVSSWC
jgi:(S)-3,5-dihydroxyphenylglycine transaminase